MVEREWSRGTEGETTMVKKFDKAADREEHRFCDDHYELDGGKYLVRYTVTNDGSREFVGQCEHRDYGDDQARAEKAVAILERMGWGAEVDVSHEPDGKANYDVVSWWCVKYDSHRSAKKYARQLAIRLDLAWQQAVKELAA
jgi:hypothetical protein